MEKVIEIENLTKSYGKFKAIDDLSIYVEKGKIFGLLGPNGSGKSTTINCILSLLNFEKGSIKIFGKEMQPNCYDIKSKIGVVFQDFKLLPKLTVYENVAFALEIFGLPSSEIHSKVLKSLELVGLKHKAKNYPNQLSGGEQQRVAIARAIVNGPKLLICDEPTGNLDENTSMEIMKVLEEINKLGTTIIMVTHDTEIVNKMKKRVILLDSGRIVRDYKEGEYTHEGN